MITYSEIFRSMQGEGMFTGRPTLWLRLFLCNLQCDGFGQRDPKNPNDYVLPYKTLDISTIRDINELPVFAQGCDSSYSWHKTYQALMHKATPSDIIKQLEALLPNPGIWNEPDGYAFDMAFTGGEPLLSKSQKHIAALLDIWNQQQNSHRPLSFTLESNGTQTLSKPLAMAFAHNQQVQVLLSFSPKLFSVSGETNKIAIKPKAIQQSIQNIQSVLPQAQLRWQLKFVMGHENHQWEELEQVIDQIGLGRSHIWIMPVGGTLESQEQHAGQIADKAIAKGYHVSARVHNYLWANAIGK